MTSLNPVLRDERTVAVEDASYRLAYGAVAFALLIDVMYRSFVRHEAAWDLLAVVIGGGLISAAYQAWRNVLTGRSVRVAAVGCVLAAALAAVVAAVRASG